MANGTVTLDRVVDTVVTLADQRGAVVFAAVLALVAVGWTAVWRWARTVVTIAHEGGHAIVAVLAGRGLTGIRLHADTSGLTVSTGARRGPGLVFTILGGYPAPSVLGLGGAALVAADRAALMLWIAIGLLVAALVHVRNAYGVFAVVVTGGLVGAVAGWGGPGLRDGFAAALCWFLLFGGVRAVRELWRTTRWTRGTSDADLLGALTWLPRSLWVILFGLVAAAAVVAAGGLLLFS
ncbi:M50 family metallopeptidase [Pseudonocardia acaciae]|uniref:M50 family metallopeptidase n=1 Tax=Pseudonocardia acaciae TaxID=551276 RepID=UPI000B302F92|nr:M50 family metallopeptidase [Pseudonocardia acaciae]